MSTFPSRLRSKLSSLRKKKPTISAPLIDENSLPPLLINRKIIINNTPPRQQQQQQQQQRENLQAKVQAAHQALESLTTLLMNWEDHQNYNDEMVMTSATLLVDDLHRATRGLTQLVERHSHHRAQQPATAHREEQTFPSWSFDDNQEDDDDEDDEEEEEIELPRAHSRLPTPDFTNSFTQDDSQSVYSQQQQEEPSSVVGNEEQQQQHHHHQQRQSEYLPYAASPLSSPFRVAPLSLPKRTTKSVRISAPPQLDRYSGSSSNMLSTTMMDDVDDYSNIRSTRHVSLPPLKSLQRQSSVSSHFSTAEKTRRLRSLRGRKSPLASEFDGEDTMVIPHEQDEEDEEPLRVEELMAYLREGRSIRDL